MSVTRDTYVLNIKFPLSVLFTMLEKVYLGGVAVWSCDMFQ